MNMEEVSRDIPEPCVPAEKRAFGLSYWDISPSHLSGEPPTGTGANNLGIALSNMDAAKHVHSILLRSKDNFDKGDLSIYMGFTPFWVSFCHLSPWGEVVLWWLLQHLFIHNFRMGIGQQ